MASFTWYLQGTTPTTIGSTDILQFAKATFDSPITITEYNDSTHIESSTGTDLSSGNSPKNSKFLTSSTVSINGGTSESLSGVTTANCPLKITFAHGVSVITYDAVFYAYDGTTTTVAPTDVTFKAAEQGSASWTTAGGSASAVALANNSTPATSHDYYILVSASPDSVGEKTAFKVRIELTYS
jgi:hypothetical protein